MRLLLLRHGEASFDASCDAVRPLTTQGRLEVRSSLERYLALESRNGKSDAELILCVSPLLRAQQTSEIVSAMLPSGFEARSRKEIDWLRPDTPIAECLSGIESLALDDAATVMLVAHNPLLSRLWSFLSDGEPFFHEIVTGQLVELDCEWLSQGCATVIFQS